jgi:hypothetical protein
MGNHDLVNTKPMGRHASLSDQYRENADRVGDLEIQLRS